jgi:hypothetical protein
MDHDYVLTRGLEKVRGEMSLTVLVSNLKRVLNILEVEALLEPYSGLLRTAMRVRRQYRVGLVRHHYNTCAVDRQLHSVVRLWCFVGRR